METKYAIGLSDNISYFLRKIEGLVSEDGLISCLSIKHNSYYLETEAIIYDKDNRSAITLEIPHHHVLCIFHLSDENQKKCLGFRV